MQKIAILDMVLEGYFLGSSFPEAPVNHSKRHTLYRCVHMYWIWCIYKFSTLGTKKLIMLFSTLIAHHVKASAD